MSPEAVSPYFFDMILIEPVVSVADLDAVRALFLEYAASPDREADFSAYLAQQGFGAEVAALPGLYASPGGMLLLARVDGELAGCVAYKPLEPPAVCEMKRLFVRPGHRGLGLAEQLINRALLEAGQAGFDRMRLDTLPSMGAAQRLYARLGFYEIPAYLANPVPGARFLEVELSRAGGGTSHGDPHPTPQP